jgi:hypothetical protein
MRGKKRQILRGKLVKPIDNVDLSFVLREKQEQQRVARARYQSAAEPLLREPAIAGYELETVGELEREWTNYKSAVPILLRWLPMAKYDALREDIVRTLTVRLARPEAAAPLVDAYRTESNEHVKWAIGNALSVVADDGIFDDIVDLVTARQHGRAREMLCFALGNMKNPRAHDVLMGLLDDDEVAGHAIRPLGKLKVLKARSKIETFTSHPKAWIRREAKRALEKIDRVAESST